MNVQDGSVIHCTYQKHPTDVGNNVSIGHNALVHGCTVHDNVLIGMDYGAVIHSNSIVNAGAMGRRNNIKGECIYAGVPAKKVKALSKEQTASLVEGIASNYVMYSNWFRD